MSGLSRRLTLFLVLVLALLLASAVASGVACASTVVAAVADRDGDGGNGGSDGSGNRVGVTVDLLPSIASPGETVDVLSTCRKGQVRSKAFAETTLTAVLGRGIVHSRAAVTIHHDLPPASYEVTADCKDGRTTTTRLLVTTSGVSPSDGAVVDGAEWPLIAGGLALLATAATGLVPRPRRAALNAGGRPER